MFGLRRKKTATGIHITDTQIKLVEIEGSSQHVDVLQKHIIGLEEGSIRNGKLVDEESVIHRLTQHVKARALQGTPVHLTLPTSNVILRKSVLPALKDQELRNMIDVELNGGSQVPFKNPVFDFVRLGPAPTEAAATAETEVAKTKLQKQESVLIFATPLEVVDSYSALIYKSGLAPVSVDIAPLAIFRILAKQQQLSGAFLPKTFMFLQLESEYADVSIFTEGIPVFMRSIQMNQGYAMDSGSEKTEVYGRNLTMELGRILNYFQYSVSTAQEEVDRIYLIGETEWTTSLMPSLESFFPGEIALFPLEQILRARDSSIQAFTVPMGLALKGVIL